MSAINGTMLQAFHWYTEGDGGHWQRLSQQARTLAQRGFTALWLPPAYKGIQGKKDVGYGVYDLYDLGAFPQKGTTRTKYGTQGEYLSALTSIHASGMQAYADVVLNHRIGGDYAETVNATPYTQNDRLKPAGGQRQIRTYTHFAFPGRDRVYSGFEWHAQHFDAVDYDEHNPTHYDEIYLLEGKQFDNQVALEKGNFAFLMGCDLDFQNPEVREEITRWGKWYLDLTGADGFRLDAIKHIAAWFFPEWLDAMERHAGRDLFVVGEYWYAGLDALIWYLEAVGGRMAVFDVPLHYNFHNASRLGSRYDLRYLLYGTLMQARPSQAVTFVENHDSQPLQALESCVDPWFKPLAYAFILLRAEGYPCVFAADYEGAEYDDRGCDGNTYHITLPSHRTMIDTFLTARRNHAYGPQYDYLDHPTTIGWTRLGDDKHPKALAVLMASGGDGWKWMEVGRKHARFRDVTGQVPEPVTTNAWGWGEFACRGGSVSVWVEE